MLLPLKSQTVVTLNLTSLISQKALKNNCQNIHDAMNVAAVLVTPRVSQDWCAPHGAREYYSRDHHTACQDASHCWIYVLETSAAGSPTSAVAGKAVQPYSVCVCVCQEDRGRVYSSSLMNLPEPGLMAAKKKNRMNAARPNSVSCRERHRRAHTHISFSTTDTRSWRQSTRATHQPNGWRDTD